VRRHRLQEGQQRRGVDEGAGRVVRVGDEHQLGVVADGGTHGPEVVAVFARRHDRGARMGVGRGLCIDHEAVLGVDDALARLQTHLRREFEDLARAAAEREPVRRHIEPGGQRVLQRGAVAVGVVAGAFERRGRRAAGRLGHAERVFIGSQEDHGNRPDLFKKLNISLASGALISAYPWHAGRPRAALPSFLSQINPASGSYWPSRYRIKFVPRLHLSQGEPP
jgi:hypothetical protein